jgi:hypothetical protein
MSVSIRLTLLLLTTASLIDASPKRLTPLRKRCSKARSSTQRVLSLVGLTFSCIGIRAARTLVSRPMSG